jgi:hypothetical protein
MASKRIMLFTAVLFVAGCLPGITVSKKDARITDNRPFVAYQFGTAVEMADWAALRDDACKDLPYAVDGIAGEARRDIIKYACVEPDRIALGEALEKLPPGALERIRDRLAEKGYDVKLEKVPTSLESLGAGLAIVILIAL